MKKIIIISSVLAALFLLLVRVSYIFIKNILAAVPNRNVAPPESPASAEDVTADPDMAASIAHRERFRIEGREFEKTTSRAESTSADGLKLRARYRMQASD